MGRADEGKRAPSTKDLDSLIHGPARLAIMANLYMLESADFTFLLNLTELTWGNLSTHVRKLEEGGYVLVEKGFEGRKPKTMLSLSPQGRAAFQRYREQMKEFFDELPD